MALLPPKMRAPLSYLMIFGLLAGVYLLPADTSLSEVRKRAGVLTGISGLDRLALSRYLRSKNVELTIVPNPADLANGLRQGRFDFGVTEMLLAGQIAAREGFAVQWAPPELPRYPLVLG